MSVRPVALGLTLCKYYFLEEGTRRASLIGTFSSTDAKDFPTLLDPFSVFAVLSGGLGDVTMLLAVSRLDTGEDLVTYRSRAHFPDKLAEIRFHLRIKQLVLPVPTYYQFVLLADGEWLAHRRLHVYQKEA